MAAKVASPAVSYGIGVQNRYSAFLEEEDAFALGLNSALGRNKLVSHNQTTIQSKSSKTLGSAGPLVARSNQGTKVSVTKANQAAKTNQEQTNKNAIGSNQQAAKKSFSNQDSRQANPRPQQQRTSGSFGNNPTQKYHQHSRAYNNQENSVNNYQRFNRNSSLLDQGNRQPPTHVVQPDTANINQTGAEGRQSIHQATKATRNNAGTTASYFQRSFANRRQFNQTNGERRPTGDDNLNNLGSPSVEEAKRRRQQKRNLDLKHKDSEKRDARRQQAVSQAHEAERTINEEERQQAVTIELLQSKGPRSRRFVSSDLIIGRNQELDNSQRTFRTANTGFATKNRVARDVESNSEHRRETVHCGNGMNQSEEADRNQARIGNDRVPRDKSKNNFGVGSRGARVPRNDAQSKFNRVEVDRHKPIPNFSDKLDFPSLAS